MAETTLPLGDQDDDALEYLRANSGELYVPSIESVSSLQSSELVLMSGQFFSAGKSTIICELEDDGLVNVPSYTNRDLRPGEVDGVDKVSATIAEMAEKVVKGSFLEIEEPRPGVFYATPANFPTGKRHIKDLELKGAMRLRSLAPLLPIVIPVPPARRVENLRVTEWERRHNVREGYTRRIDDKKMDDLEGRLYGVVEESTRILETGIAYDPNAFVIVNDDLASTVKAIRTFLATREKPLQRDINSHIQALRDIAKEALKAA